MKMRISVLLVMWVGTGACLALQGCLWLLLRLDPRVALLTCLSLWVVMGVRAVLG